MAKALVGMQSEWKRQSPTEELPLVARQHQVTSKEYLDAEEVL